MITRADCSFHIGAQHLRSGLPCQDYAAVSAAHGGTYAVVSDGCSSGGRTDIGARVVTLAEMRSFCEGLDWRYQVDLAKLTLGLRSEDLLATAVSLCATDGGVSALIRGDGVVAFQRRDGTLKMVKAEWADNRPFYPIYAEDDCAAFTTAHGGRNVGAFFITSDTCGTVRHTVYPVCHGIPGFHFLSHHDLQAAAVFSDGVCQVDGMTWQEVVRELMAFKSTRGDFVKRRMNRFLSSECYEYGRGPIDDIAMAAIVFEEE